MGVRDSCLGDELLGELLDCGGGSEERNRAAFVTPHMWLWVHHRGGIEVRPGSERKRDHAQILHPPRCRCHDPFTPPPPYSPFPPLRPTRSPTNPRHAAAPMVWYRPVDRCLISGPSLTVDGQVHKSPNPLFGLRSRRTLVRASGWWIYGPLTPVPSRF